MALCDREAWWPEEQAAYGQTVHGCEGRASVQVDVTVSGVPGTSQHTAARGSLTVRQSCVLTTEHNGLFSMLPFLY